MEIKNFADAKAEYCSHGGHFFDRKTMKYWHSRIESGLYKNRCFVTSELDFDEYDRKYTIRRFSEDFQHIETVGEFGHYSRRISAIEAAKKVI